MQIESNIEDSLQAYTLLFNRTRFGFTSRLNMQHLKYFSVHNQARLGKIDIKVNINALRGLRNTTELNYIVMTEYQQIVPIMYWLRSQPMECRVLTTKSMLESAKIYAQDFYSTVKKINQVVTVPTYEQQSQAYQNYQLQLQVDFSRWVGIYSRQQMNNCFSRCLALNYGQVYDTDRGTLVVGFPSGVHIGSAVWLFENAGTKNRVLWVQGLSHHSWRACQEFRLHGQYREINTVIFTQGTLNKHATSVSDEQQCLQFLKNILNRLNKGLNTRIVIEDFLIMADIINYLAIEFKDKFRQLIFTGGCASHYISYINSYVQFLTGNHQRRIFEDPPVYPFDTYEQLRDKLISHGTLEEISQEKKIPLKEIVLRFTPYLQFQADYHAYLVEGDNEVVERMFEKYYSLPALRGILAQHKVQQIFYLCRESEDLRPLPELHPAPIPSIIGETLFIQKQSQYRYYTAEGSPPQLISGYGKKNGWLCLHDMDRIFREVNRDWYNIIGAEFNRHGIETVYESATEVRTRSTRVWMSEYRLRIEGSSEKQIEILNNVINKTTRLFKIS